MAQFFEKIEKALKDFYLPAWKNSVNLEITPLIAEAEHVKWSGRKIVSAAEVGANGGFGFGTDSGPTPVSGAQMFEQFNEEVKDIFCNIEISDKVVQEAMGGNNIIDPLDAEIKGAFKTSKFHVGRSFYGNGRGILAWITSASESTATVASCKYLTIGATVDVYSGDESNASLTKGQVRIKNIDRAKNAVTFDKEVGSVQGGFITLQNSYNKELTGLGSIFDSEIKTLYGLDKAGNYYLNPIAVDVKKDISDTLVRQVLRDSENYNNGNVDMLIAGNGAYDAYANYLRLNGYRVEDSTLTLKGGFKGIKFLNGSKEIAVVNDKHVPDNEIWGFEKASIKFYDLGDWRYVDTNTGGIFTLVNGYSIYRALLACYTNVICSHPGGCVRLYNVCEGDGLEKLMHNKTA